MAVVGREEGEPAVMVLVDVGDKMPVVRKLLERAERQALSDGQTKRTEDVDGVTVTILDDKATFCDRDNTVLFSSSPELIKEMLKIWTGDEGVETLADNLRIHDDHAQQRGNEGRTAASHLVCRPDRAVQEYLRQNTGGQMALAMLPVLGLDGVKSAGGSYHLRHRRV